MNDMRRFNLPDLGEGLQEAEIVRWHVAVGDTVAVDQPMVAMETAKAVVEVPSPWDGIVLALHGKPGDTVATGAPLVDFRGEEKADAPASVPQDAATRARPTRCLAARRPWAAGAPPLAAAAWCLRHANWRVASASMWNRSPARAARAL
jgi:2-oxoisovalerate dehydrogenase E2 component (dihydrolipoyl transacylase)